MERTLADRNWSASIAVAFAAAALGLSLLGCGPDAPTTTTCTAGTSSACICLSGQSGTQVCQTDGTQGACTCGSRVDAGSDAGGSLPVSDAGASGGVDGGSSWTLLVYMNADNDLESFALEDLKEMMAVGSSPSFHLVVQIDRSPGYANGPIGGLPDFSDTKRLLVQKDSLQVVQSLGEVDLAAPAALSDFVSWGLGAYPAANTAVLFWDHGGGWAGFGVDETTGPGQLLTLPEIESGLRQGLSNKKVTLLGYDACLMAGYETALTMAPFGDYLVASEDVEPGHGWDWRVVDMLRQRPGTTAEQFGQQIIATYREQAKANQGDATVTLSLIDLREMGKVKTALDAFSAAVKNGGSTAATALGRAREQARSFQSSTPDPSRSQFLYDLDHLLRLAAGADSTLAPTQGAVSDAIAKAVRGNFAGSAQVGSAGLSVYFPPSADVERAAYANVSAAASWKALLTDLYGAVTVVPTFLSTSTATDLSWASNGDLVVEGTLVAGAAQAVSTATLFYGYSQGGAFYILGDQPAALTGDTVSSTWDLTSLTVSQKSQKAFGYSSLSITGSSVLLSIDFVYLAPGASALQYAPRLIALQLSGSGTLTVVSDTHYVQNGEAFGELVPQAGSSLWSVVQRIDASGNLAYVKGATAPFTPTTATNGRLAFDVDFAFEALPSQTQAFVALDVANSADKHDTLAGSIAIP